MFEFKGDWIVDCKLEEFAILDNADFNHDLDKVSQGVFDLQIVDSFNYDPDPANFKIDTINWLFKSSNQLAILRSLFSYCKDIVYPHYKEFMSESEYPESYPKLDTVRDLRNLLGITSIKVQDFEKEGFAYLSLFCESCLDHEHGITFGVYKESVLEHGEDLSFQKVFKHLGYNAFKDMPNRSRIIDRKLVIDGPNMKYGKYKPWQVEAVNYYPYGLYHKVRDIELIEDIENSVINNTDICSKLINLSIKDGRENLTQYFLSKELKVGLGTFLEALKKDRFDITDKFIEQGFNINLSAGESSLMSKTIWELGKALAEVQDLNKYKIRIEYLLNNGFDPYLEDNFKRNSLTIIARIKNDTEKRKVDKIVNSILGKKL